MLRVVVPGGKALFSSWAAPDENTLLGVGEAALRAALPEHPQLGLSAPLTQPDACAQELESIGFEQVGAHRFQKRLRFASIDEYWSAFEKTSPLLFLLREELGAEAYARMSEVAQGALLATCGDASFELNASAILTVGEQPLSAA
jgi:hypothetical protein